MNVTPSEVLALGIALLVFAPVAAAVLAFVGPPLLRQLSRGVLLLAWLAHVALTLVILYYAFFTESDGIGNQVLVFFALPTVVMALLFFVAWKAARRRAYVESLPPAERRVEELYDIRNALDSANEALATAERKLQGWSVSRAERQRLQFEIAILRRSIATLERKRAALG